ncbi:MAG TPA: hypothetical protein VMY39_03090, partial [Planctomycetota bacterium]|nr:hypothetical protein [Planctomycetota bacterium]
NGEATYAQGFPRFYNEVFWHPSQAGLERVFWRDQFDGVRPASLKLSLRIPRRKARALVQHRWGPDGRPGDGSDRWAVGWRRDAATYYHFSSPENPRGDSRYFGANEVMEHDHSAFNPRSSNIIDVLTYGGIAGGLTPEAAQLQARKDWRKLKPYVTMGSTDTILRGIIWPTEGPPFTSTRGDWRHIDILKRVNLNLIGAKGPEGLAGEDVELKTAWAAKRDRERTRLYYMLVAGLAFSNTGADDAERRHVACQFIASLADMVDRDDTETIYVAPDGSGTWAMGVEKHPVINEAVMYLTNASSPDYTLRALRVELCNPAENIPWIPDVDETYDVAEYLLRVGSHDYRVGDLHRYGTVWADDWGRVDASDVNRNIGADGLFADPADATARSWNRLMTLGWDDAGSIWPPGLSKTEVEAPVAVSLWKPLDVTGLTGSQAADLELAPGVTRINGILYTCVDRTPTVRMMPDYRNDPSLPGPGGSSSTFTGIYRRWDPMNPAVYGTPGTDEKSNVIWCKGWGAAVAGTLGKPNVDYPRDMTTKVQTAWNGTDRSPYKYRRCFERNWKVVDGDLPSVGWLGEMMMRNPAQDGPLTSVNDVAQNPTANYTQWTVSKLDTHAKFDLFRPFRPVAKYNPTCGECRTENLHMLDIFTVWDPSNDGIDNDGDGAVDDEDTGNQAGDRCGPEVR